MVKKFDPISLGRQRSWRNAAIATAAVIAVLLMGMVTPDRANATGGGDPTQNVSCDVISADYHRPLTNGDHINVTLDPPGGQVNMYVDQNIAGGASYNGQNNLGLRWKLFGVEQTPIPLTLDEVLSGVITFNYGPAVRNLGIDSWTVSFVQTNSTDTWPGLECGEPTPPEPPTVPEPSISYSEWQDGQWKCGDTSVTQTRTKTTIPQKAVLEDGKWIIVEDTDAITTVTETQTRPLTQSEIESCEPVTPEPPTVPEPKVTYTVWQDGSFECGDTSVTQTRTKTTTPFKVELKEGKWVIVEDTAGITTATETRTRPLTESEIESCEVPPKPVVVPEMYFHDSCDITDDSWSATGELSEDEKNVFISDGGILRVSDQNVDGSRTVEGVFMPNPGTYVPQPGKGDTYVVEDGNAVWRYTFTNEPCPTTPPTTPPATPPTTAPPAIPPTVPPVVTPEQPVKPQPPVTSQVTGKTLASTGSETLPFIGGAAFLLLAGGAVVLMSKRRRTSQ